MPGSEDRPDGSERRDRRERRDHFRSKPTRVLAVRYCVAGDAWIAAQTRNVGTGGAFIATPDPPAIGSVLRVELWLPTTDQRFALPATVRWCAADGMGVEFTGVDVDVLLELNDYFASL